MIETSLKPQVVYLWLPSEIFGNLWKKFEKCLDTFVKPSEQFSEILRKWSEIFGKSSKTLLLVCLY